MSLTDWMVTESADFVRQTFFYMMSIVPLSETSSLMRYEVYRHKNTSPEALKKDLEFFGQVESEDKWLASGSQSNLNSDTYTVGPLHPEVEQAVTFVTKLVKTMLHEHVDKEKKDGSDWWPARRIAERTAVEEDESFCRDVCASPTNNDSKATDVLAW